MSSKILKVSRHDYTFFDSMFNMFILLSQLIILMRTEILTSSICTNTVENRAYTVRDLD